MSAPPDLWAAMVRALTGERPPRLPELHGQVHHLEHSEGDPIADAWEARHLSATTTTESPAP